MSKRLQILFVLLWRGKGKESAANRALAGTDGGETEEVAAGEIPSGGVLTKYNITGRRALLQTFRSTFVKKKEVLRVRTIFRGE